MKVEILKVGFLKENCYILIIGEDVIVIDPGDDFVKIKEKIKNKNLKVVLITHRHFDHVGALNDLLKEYNVPVLDKNNLEEKEYLFGQFKFNVIFTPGHSNDSVTYFFEKDNCMFVGDFIFNGTIGRCDLDGGDFALMKKSLKKIKKYNNCIIYPGHGNKTTLYNEIKNNPYF